MTRTREEILQDLHKLIHEIEHKDNLTSRKEYSDDNKARKKRK
jgi:hypothetical protein